MASIANCLKKLGIDTKHEDAIISGLAVLDEQGKLGDYKSAYRALRDAHDEAVDERDYIREQVLKSTGYDIGETSVKGTSANESLTSGLTKTQRALDVQNPVNGLQRTFTNAGYNYRVQSADVWGSTPKDWDKAQTGSARTAENLSRAFGKRIVWVDTDGDFNGVVTKSQPDVIFLNTKSKNKFHVVMGHELSHHMENDSPEAYQEMVASLEPLIKNHKVYKDRPNLSELDDIDITKEIVGDLVGDNFDKPEFWDKVAQSNPTGFKKIADSITKWLKLLLNKVSGNNFGSENFVTDIQNAQSIIADALAKYQKGNLEESNLDSVNFSKRIHGDIKNNEDYVIPESAQYKGNQNGDLGELDGLPIRLRVGEHKDEKKGFGIEHIAENNSKYPYRKPIKNTGDSAEDISNEIAQIANDYKEIYNDKATGRKVLRYGKIDKAIIVERRDDDGSFWSVVTSIPLTRTEASIRFGKKLDRPSTRNLVPASTESDSVVYTGRQREDGKIEDTQPRGSIARTHANDRRQSGGERLRNQSSKYNVSTDKNNNQADVVSKQQDVKFSKQEIENTLMAKHNITEEGLIHADKIGGLAAPSVAITKTSHSFDKFGDITLIADKDLIDPKSGAKVYASDVYSTRYPNVYYRFDKDSVNKLNSILRESIDESKSSPFTLNQLSYINTFNEVASRESVVNLFYRERGIKPPIKLTKNSIAKDGMIEEYSNFVLSIMQKSGASEKIISGKSKYGRDIFIDHTIENVVRILKRKVVGGEYSSSLYGGGVRSHYAEKFKSIKDIKSTQDLLVSKSDFEKSKQLIAGMITSVHASLSKYGSAHIDDVLIDAARNGVIKALNDNGFKGVPDRIKFDIQMLMNKLSLMPTEYFEAKILRAVGLGEFKAAVVPDNISDKARKILERNGISDIREYKAGDSNDRANRVRSFDDLKFSRTLGWDNLPKAIISKDSVTNDPNYNNAKNGDFNAAVNLVNDNTNKEFFLKIKMAIGNNTNSIVVPVRSVEQDGLDNAIPEALASVISDKLNLAVDINGIRQNERVGRTGSDGWHRIANQPTFSGDVINSNYIIADDTLAQGGTVAQLKEYIESNGGKVILVTALTGKQYSATIGLQKTTLSLLREKHGSIEKWFKESFGYGFDGLTESEARYIISAKGLSSNEVRERIASAKREGEAGNLQDEIQNSGIRGVNEDRARAARDVSSGMEKSSEKEISKSKNNLKFSKIFNHFDKIGEDKGNILQADKDARRITGLDISIPKIAKELDVSVPAKLDLDTRQIWYNKNWNYSKALGAQSIAEEFFHAIDLIKTPDVTFSASSDRLHTLDGDIYQEALKHHNDGGEYAEYLTYPLSVEIYPDLSAHHRQAELFARLGVLYSGDLKRMNDFLPLAYEAYHGVFRAEESSGGEDVFRNVWRIRSLHREIGGELRPNEGHVKDNGAGGENWGGAELERLHKRMGEAFSGKIEGKKVLFSKIVNKDINQDVKFTKFNETIATTADEKDTTVDSIPEETKSRAIQRKVQDSFNRFNVIKEWLADKGINLSEQADVYSAEERYHSKVANQLEDFRNNVRNPLIERIAKAGFTLSDVSDFLEAQHAKEANKQIRELRNDPTTTAYGITDEEAQAYLDKAPKELATLSNELRDITNKAKQLRLDNGILNKDITDKWESTYKHYIPVKGGDVKQGTGKGLKVNHKDKRRLGHGKRDEAVIENILMDYERAVMEVEKNRVGKHVVMMAAEANNPDLMTIGQPVKRNILKNTTAYEVNVDGKTIAVFETKDGANQYVKTLNAKPGTVEINPTADQRVIAQASPMLADNEINVYMEGHAVRVQINDPLLARAYTKVGIENYGDIVAAGRAINGFLSKMYTGYNPEFILTNIIRDFTSGITNLTGEQGIGMAMKTIANYPKSFATLMRYAASDGLNSTDIIDSYRANGGNTGAAYLGDLERLGTEVATEYASYQGVIANLKAGDSMNAARAAGRKVFNATLKWIYNLNQAGENAMRLSAYKAMLDSGKSVNEAAKVAKNITVNFNRKGELGQTANALYLFFNASVQGTAAVAHALTKGKHKYQARALATSMIALGYIAAAAFGGGDEDEYDKVDDYTKERNMLIKSGEGYVKIPIPYGYGFFFNLGRTFADAQRKDDLGKLPWHVATSAIQELTPLGNLVNSSSQGFETDQVLGGISPTVIQIPYQIANNKQLFSGVPLFPESSFDKSQPDRDKMYRGTKGTLYDEVAGLLSQGGMDVSPETLKFMTRTITGGAGALVDSTVSAGMLAKEGATLEPKEMPFIRKMYTKNDIRNDRDAYNKSRTEAQTASEQFKRLQKTGDVMGAQKFMNDNRELIALDIYADRMAKFIKAERDQQDAIRLDESIPTAEKRLKLKILEDRESTIYDKYLDTFELKKLEMKSRVSKSE